MTILDGLNPAQREAASVLSGPVLILAGAGSGKTRTLTHRLAWLISKGVQPGRILAVTFTNKAAAEMRARVEKLIGADATRALWIGTFHAVCARMLRRDGHRIGLDRNFTIYDSDESLTLIKRICKARNVDERDLKPSVVREEISRAKNQLWTPDEYIRERQGNAAPYVTTVGEIYREYQSQLAANNAADFDDLLVHPVRLFRAHPDVLADYQRRFEHLLIDEYQDTNHAQYLLVKHLAERHHNVCAVGDDDQSIYGWRGADISNILNFEADYPEASVIRLEQNYRSTKRILKAAGAVVGNNVHRKGKELWTENVDGEPITVAELDDEVREAEWVLERVQAERRAGRRYTDVVILYRTNAQSRPLEEAFVRARVPYTIVGGLRFYERKEIRDALAYLRVIDNPRDAESLRRIINTPKRGIGDSTVARLGELAAESNTTLLDAMREHGAEAGPRTAKQIAGFVALIDGLRAITDALPANDVLHKALHESGYIRALEDEGTVEAETRRQNLDELLAAATRFAESNDDPSVGAFLQEVSLVTDIDAWDEGTEALTLMTLHSAKGLEFPVVFVTGLEEGLFPISGAFDDPRQLEEERRLLYVGLTRAMERAFLTRARRRRRYGEWSEQIASRFLGELPPDVVSWERSGFTMTYGNATRNRGDARAARPGRRAEVDEFVQEAPAYESYSQETKYPEKTLREKLRKEQAARAEVTRVIVEEFLAVGRYVIHPMFGRGKIVAHDGVGADLKVTIKFDNGPTKKIVARVAHLEPTP